MALRGGHGSRRRRCLGERTTQRAEGQRLRLWKLRRSDAEVSCEARPLRVGIEGRIVWNGRELYALLFASGEELSVCAGEKRAELETKGWTPPPDL